jgi:hypothetical protein
VDAAIFVAYASNLGVHVKLSQIITSVIAVLALPMIGMRGLDAQDASPSAPGAILTPLDAAAVDASRSSSATTLAQINFVNQSGSPVDIYWITYGGKRMLFSKGLPVGASWKVGTFVTHRWLVVVSGSGGTTERDTGVRLAGFEALTPYGDTALIGDVPGIGVPVARQRDAAQPRYGVVLTPLDAATVDDASHSSGHITQARITFVNQSRGAVDIYWITYQGRRMLYRAGLPVGAATMIGTFLTHPWLIVASGTGGTTDRDTGVRVAAFEALTSNGDTAIIH